MESRVQPPSGHDACGVGFIAHLRGRAGRDIVSHGLSALRRLTHRGADPSLGAVDGCGLLTAIPWTWVADAFGDRLAAARTRGLGMLFVHQSDRLQAAEIIERELRLAGARSIDWRLVPIDRAAVLRAQRDSTPKVLQVVAGFDEGRQAADAALYRARLRIERIARAAGLRLTIVSLSTRTVVHKALVAPDALDRFFPDLADERFISPFITFHQRFSTNTSTDWALAQPFRTVAHNGEINTITGNRLWMRARAADATALPGFDLEPPISTHGSDSLSLDDAIELLRHNGYALAHAITRLVPPAWERDRDLPPDVRAFYEFQSLVSEPWDGPSAIVFADGRCVGAALDRNGFRSARMVSTADDLIAVASEVGVLPADEHEIVNRGRLGPGDMVVVDVERGSVMGTNEIRRRLAFRRRYRRLVADVVRPLADPVGVDVGTADGDGDVRSVRLPPSHEATADHRSLRGGGQADLGPASASAGSQLRRDEKAGHYLNTVDLARRQAAAGCSREEIELLLKPMAADGHEAVGAMGDDAAPAALSQRPRLFSDFFRQRFAQVTNPAVDPYRESSVMSLTTILGGHGSFIDELAPRPARIVLRSPILSRRELEQLGRSSALQPITIGIVFPAAGGVQAFDLRLHAIADEACAAVERGSALVILTDRRLSADLAAVPALMAQAAVHHALLSRGLRMRASLIVDTADARDAHQIGLLAGYGASAVCPSLAYDTIAALAGADPTGCDVAVTRYRLALERGLRTLMSKMGVCTFSGYCGAQLFEILGLNSSLVDRFFPGTASPVGGATLADIAAPVLARHQRAFADAAPAADYPGLHDFHRDGEYHATNPMVVRGLQQARDEALGQGGAAAQSSPAYETFTSHVYGRPASAIRDLLELVPAEAVRPVPLDEVESVEAICRRFFAPAMSVGALSPETHRTIATAMNRLGARSNSGEGGEEADRFIRPTSGPAAARLEQQAGSGEATLEPLRSEGADWDGSRTKQVASARFGVTPAYLRSADELQIKIAQGSKPGEGGQLAGLKVTPHIARLRHAQAGTTLISPPVHHDIYSIEDLAELIYDLRAFHPTARMNVKLVASSGVGIIATGVAKAGADAIQISGHDGGTGASPRASIKHAGMPWELGLSEAHHALTRAGLRGRLVLQTDGGLKTGRDIAMAAALGAEEYGFGTAALVALGCVMARQCHANTCPAGIATQREDLRAGFAGTADMLVGYLKLVAGEVREILASVGLTRLENLVGRADLLRRRAGIVPSIVLDQLLRPATSERPAAPNAERRTSNDEPRTPNAERRTPNDFLDTVTPDHPFAVTGAIANTDRAFGAGIAGAIAARFGDRGLPEGSVHLAMTGSAGQSFGAFCVPGMRLSLVGDANDGLGKGMHGGEIVVAPAARERGRANQVLAGNAALYGATGGRLFVAGLAGERFAVRNSGATAVVEGVGDHACEYMTAGLVVVIGGVGENFAAGMTGGVIYVAGSRESLAARTNPQQLAIDAPTLAEQKQLRELLETHERLTGSRVARSLLRFDRHLAGFCRVTPAAAEAAAPLVETEPVAQAV